jgi:hypothetical protein
MGFAVVFIAWLQRSSEDGNSSATSNAWTLTQPDLRFC